MKRTLTGVVAVTALAVTLSACSSSKSSSKSSGTGQGGGTAAGSQVLSTDGKGKTITVWLQSDAQKGWPAVVSQATTRFEAATGAKVKVQWQQWSNYTTKLDSTFAGKTGIPDVVELGNTQTASYIAGGAFTDLSAAKSQFANSATWLTGLTQSGTSSDGKLEAIPYYAGSRVVIYRKDLWTKAGVTSVPTTLAALNADLAKVKAANAKDPRFSAFYMPGKYWYAAMSFVYGAGGQIATMSGGKWTGTLDSASGPEGSGRVEDAGNEVLGRRDDQGRGRPGRDHGPRAHRRHRRQRLGGWRGHRTQDRQAGARPEAVDLPDAGRRRRCVHPVVPRRL